MTRRLVLALFLLLTLNGCKFVIKEFNSSVGELDAETKGFDK